ncbi:ATP-dependent DNA ligase [Ascodesmis nigricans]|uniref:DNA ligase n=1 Tax=Ascodesmis nigricans TaxID=341454 RepID=A0A4S2MT09_9PEZI|nr:ATP-dependent DNA ligase [Ascodesmis nigricans]
MPKGSPAKKPKKAPAKPAQTRTLHYFFAKQAAPKSPAATSSAPSSTNDGTAAHGLTDEEYARKLAKEWAKEDNSAPGAQPNSVRLKRKRSSSVSSESSKTHQTEPSTPVPDISTDLTPAQVETNELPKPTEVSPKADEEIRHIIDDLPFDSDPFNFNPDSYTDLIKNWPNRRATYALLTRAFMLVDGTRSRIKIVDTLVNFIRTLIRLDPESLLPAVWLTTNDIGPPYENNELGVGSSIITKAITKTSGITAAALKKLYNKYGDAGDVAFSAKSKQSTLMMRKPTPLIIENVYKTLCKIAATSGKGSQEAKESLVKRLLVDAKGEEIRYLVRTLVQHLRIGAVKTTVITALARAFTLSAQKNACWTCPEIPSDKEGRQEVLGRAESILAQSFARRPNYNDLIPVLLQGGVEAVKTECGMALHIPLKPMLGQITRDLEEMIVKLQKRDFVCEWKYDGQRAQIHCDADGKVSIFSRHLELMTDKYPDLVQLMPKIRADGVSSFILEGEVTAVNQKTGELMNFQTLAGRERKNVNAKDITVDVCLFAFDLMYLNGKELLSRPLRERRELLHSMFIEIPHHFTWVNSLVATSNDVAEIRNFFQAALSARCEGIMVKVLDNVLEPAHPVESEDPKRKPATNTCRKPLLATYEPDKRLESWLKVKKDYTNTADTLDLIPIGGWHGNGRKAKWWSPILLAVRNPSTGTLDAVCKCMSGFTDAAYTEMRAFYDPDEGINAGTTKKAYVESPLNPPVWFEPREVWEIAFADITLSPTYSAALGLVSDERGLSLRFPRFLRKRPDKSIDEASTSEFLADLYFKQEQAGGVTKHDAVMDNKQGEDDVEEEEDSGREKDDIPIGDVFEQEISSPPG